MKETRKEPALDPVEIALILLVLGVLFLVFPALIFHSETPQGAWHWNIRCTVACAVWWCFLLLCVIGRILKRANSPHVREQEKLAGEIAELEALSRKLEREEARLASLRPPLRPDLREL